MRTPVRLASVIAIVATAGFLSSCGSSGKNSYAAPVAPAAPGELNGSLSSTGSQYAHTFMTAGTFTYHCTIHPACGSLQGSVTVVAPAVAIQNRVLAITITGGSAAPYASCSSLSQQADSVHVGDQVTWTNNSPLPHNVTSR